MERHTVLKDVTRCILPSGFSEQIGERSGTLENCLKGMLCADAEKRLSCEAVRECIENLLEDMDH